MDTWNHSESTRQIVLVRTLVITVLVNELPCVFLLSELVSRVIQILVFRHIGVHHQGCIGQGTQFFQTDASLGTERKRKGNGRENTWTTDAREPFSWLADAQRPVTR